MSRALPPWSCPILAAPGTAQSPSDHAGTATGRGDATVPEKAPPDWPERFATIVEHQRGRLVRWLTAIFHAGDAEDIAHEALLRLYLRPQLLTGPSDDPWPWLSVVARNVGIDMLRHRAYSTPVSPHTLQDLPGAVAVHELVAARQDALLLVEAMSQLTAEDRWLIEQRHLQGRGVADIAARLGMKGNAVRQRLFRARNRLARLFVSLEGQRPSHAVPDAGQPARCICGRRACRGVG